MCELNDLEFPQFIKEMRRNPSAVKNLYLAKNNINPHAEELGDLLAENNSLHHATLLNNNLGTGLSAVVKGLRRNKSLVTLRLREGYVEDEVAKDLADIVEKNALQSISLEFDIGSKGVDLIMNALKKNKSLQYFSLLSPLYDNNIVALRDMIQNNQRLEELQLSDRRPSGASKLVVKTNDFRAMLNNALQENALLGKINIRTSAEEERDQDFSNTNTNQIYDAVRDYSAILLARMIKKSNSTNPEYDSLLKLERQALHKTKALLLNNLTNTEMLAFSEHWHSPFHQITSQKLRDYDNASWSPIFYHKEIRIPETVVAEKGWKLVTLTTPEELKKEGRDLQHCVGGYSSLCLKGNSHIVSVVDAQGKAVSTIEFTTRHKELVVRQHYGRNNQEPARQSNEAKALRWLWQEVQKESIDIDYDNIKAAKSIRGTISLLGFNPDKLENVIKVYKKQMLPSGKYEIAQLSKNFLEDFLGEVEVEIDGKKVILESTLKKDKSEEEIRLHKIKAGIQGSTNKICGKDAVIISTIDDKVFFSTQSSAALEKLQELFKGKYEQKEEGLLITEGLDPQGVRQILTRKAKAERDEKRGGSSPDNVILGEPRSIVQNPTSEAQGSKIGQNMK